MTGTTGEDNHQLLAHVLLPVANEADAQATAVHVVEKGEGVPDKTPVEQSKEIAAAAYAAVRTVFPDADDHTTYARDVVDAIVEAGEEVGATAIAYRPREEGRLMQLLSGDFSQQLVVSANLPVIALPRVEKAR